MPICTHLRTWSMWLRLSAGPSSSSLIAKRSTFPRSGAFLNLMWMNLETRCLEDGLSPMAVGSNVSWVMTFWTNDRLCTHGNISTTPFLFVPTDKPYFLSKNFLTTCTVILMHSSWLPALKEIMPGEDDEEQIVECDWNTGWLCGHSFKPSYSSQWNWFNLLCLVWL